MPCFPGSKAQVVEPEPQPLKNVHRYGETNIRHLEARPREHWQSSSKYQGRQLPTTPRPRVYDEEPHQLRRKPAHLSNQTYTDTPRTTASQAVSYRSPRSDRGTPNYQAPPPPRDEAAVRHRPPKPKTADFFLSVPIFNETLDHSYRRKNTYVYRNSAKDSEAHYHQTLTRASSARSLDRSSRHRPMSGQPTSYKKEHRRRRPHSAHMERYRTDEYQRSGGRLVQTLPADAYRRPRSHRESPRVVEHRRPYSAQVERHGPRREEYVLQTSGQQVVREDDYYGPVYIRPTTYQSGYVQRRHKHRTASEASYDSRMSARSFGSTFSYESERFGRARKLRKAPSSIGISIDSDEEDYR